MTNTSKEMTTMIPGLNLVPVTDMVIDDNKLAEIAAQSETGVKHQVSLPNIQIFHSTVFNDSIHPEGSFVLGMTKFADGADKGKIQNQGKLVVAFTVLAARKQYNYYNDKDVKESCDSNFFVDFKETIKGHKHGFVCGKKGNCPHIKREGDPKDKKGCSCQIVLLGKAHCADGTTENARFYAKGSAFMPTSKLLDTGYKINTPGGMKNIECFMAPVMLGTEGPKINGTTKYYEPTYNIVTTYPCSEWDGLLNESKNAVEYFKGADAHKSGKDAEEAPQQPVQQPVYQAPAPQAPVQNYSEPQTPAIDGGVDPVAAAQLALEQAQVAAAQALKDAEVNAAAAQAAAAAAATPVHGTPVGDAGLSMEQKLQAIMNGAKA